MAKKRVIYVYTNVVTGEDCRLIERDTGFMGMETSYDEWRVSLDPSQHRKLVERNVPLSHYTVKHEVFISGGILGV